MQVVVAAPEAPCNLDGLTSSSRIGARANSHRKPHRLIIKRPRVKAHFREVLARCPELFILNRAGTSRSSGDCRAPPAGRDQLISNLCS
jgi:hypothetical protein